MLFEFGIHVSVGWDSLRLYIIGYGIKCFILMGLQVVLR